MPAAFDIEITLRALRDVAGNSRRRRKSAEAGGTSGPVDILFCMVDHYEPQVGGAAADVADRRLAAWLEKYPRIADRHRDADGRKPTHSFFYPWDEYRLAEMEPLQAMCSRGYGEIELHLHHRDDTEATLRAKIVDAIAEYRSRGALSCWPAGSGRMAGKPAFGFIHGNWALDNSRQDNGRNYCGVNSEIRLLSDLGCYADFTFPAWQQTAQPRITNAIYYATDDPSAPKSHDCGIRARVGASERGDLLLVQGALVPYISRTPNGARPAMDDSDIAWSRRYEPARADRWIAAAIHVEGCGSRIFVKLHCHGAADKNSECMLGSDLETLFSDLEARYNDGVRWRLHYTTAREMFNVIRATELAPTLPVDDARDYLLKPPA